MPETAARYGVGATPLREALSRLAARGLVNAIGNRHYEQRCGRCESGNRGLGVQNRSGTDKTDAWNNLRRDASAVRFRSGELPRQNGKHRRAEADKHVRSQPSRPVSQLPFQSNDAASAEFIASR